MNTEKPIESHTAADFLQYALDNPVQPSPDEELDVESKSHEQVDPSTAPSASSGSARDDNEPSAEAEDEDISEESEENTEETDSESEDRTEPDEDDQTDDEDDNPQLDPLIEELAKGNPNAEKRVKEIAQGLQKLKTESKQLKTDLETTKPRADAWDSYQKALEDPMFAGPTLEKLIEAVAQHHGLDIEELIPTLLDSGAARAALQSGARSPHSKPDEHNPAWMRRGYVSEKEMQLETELRTIKSALQGFQRTQNELQKERAAAQQKAEFKNYVDEIAPKTIRRLEKLENGWKVSKGMVEKAIREFPQLKDDPTRAVKAAFADELKSHYAKQASQARKQRGPEMLPDTRGKGQSMKPPLQTTAADIYALLDQ